MSEVVYQANKPLTGCVKALMIRSAAHRLCVLATLALLSVSCTFGHSIERPDDLTVVENLGEARYIYRSTRLQREPPRGPAAPVLGIAPAGAREIALIEVTTSYRGPDELRSRESEFYSTLANIAGGLGGTHFLILRSTRADRVGHWISSLTVDVLFVPSQP
jgi:hypothetical protein